jgi:hypothetical protein
MRHDVKLCDIVLARAGVGLSVRPTLNTALRRGMWLTRSVPRRMILLSALAASLATGMASENPFRGAARRVRT